MKHKNLKAPFPYFGGKSLIAPRVWELFRDVCNYVEPFAGSLAVLLQRPTPFKGPETVNDYSCFVINAWRAIQADPKGLARLCARPVSEVNAEAEHFALVEGEDALRNLLGSPEAYDLKRAAWWVRGCAEWIGSGYCGGHGPWKWSKKEGWVKHSGKGVNRQISSTSGKGVHRQVPSISGVGEVELRVDWLLNWFSALSDRLVSVRIACGDWRRVLTRTPTVIQGKTGVFLDPPYEGTESVYGRKTEIAISAQVREWCAENGSNRLLSIVLCGRGTEHDDLLQCGYKRENWKTRGGYAKEGNGSEVIWHNIQKSKRERARFF